MGRLGRACSAGARHQPVFPCCGPVRLEAVVVKEGRVLAFGAAVAAGALDHALVRLAQYPVMTALNGGRFVSFHYVDESRFAPLSRP